MGNDGCNAFELDGFPAWEITKDGKAFVIQQSDLMHIGYTDDNTEYCEATCFSKAGHYYKVINDLLFIVNKDDPHLQRFLDDVKKADEEMIDMWMQYPTDAFGIPVLS